MNVLMTLAALGAAAIGQWSEAGLVVFLFGLGTVLQVATLERTRRAITGLMALTPPEAVVVRDGAEVDRPARRHRPGRRRARAAGGARRRRRRRARRPRRRRPGTGHRRIAPGRQGTRRPGVRRLHHRGRHAAPARHQRRRRQHHRQDRPSRGGSAGAARAGRDNRRPLRGALHARRRGAGGGRRLRPAAAGRLVRHLVLPRPGAPHHQLPVRARDLHAGEHPRRALAGARATACSSRAAPTWNAWPGSDAVAFDKTGTLTVGRPQVTDVVALGSVPPERVFAIAAAVEAAQRAPAGAGHRRARRRRAGGSARGGLCLRER